MFSGIISTTGRVVSTDVTSGDMCAVIDAGNLPMDDVQIGDSICVNGVCLTVTQLSGACFTTDISSETLSCTTFADLLKGMTVNLEKALRVTDRLHGHIVTGHVDGTGTIVSMIADARSVRYEIGIPAILQRYVCKKGSICIDGVSLTVNEITAEGVSVNIIPHTLTQTRFATYHPGTRVNLEVDIIARYLERLEPGKQ